MLICILKTDFLQDALILKIPAFRFLIFFQKIFSDLQFACEIFSKSIRTLKTQREFFIDVLICKVHFLLTDVIESLNKGFISAILLKNLETQRIIRKEVLNTIINTHFFVTYNALIIFLQYMVSITEMNSVANLDQYCLIDFSLLKYLYISELFMRSSVHFFQGAGFTFLLLTLLSIS